MDGHAWKYLKVTGGQRDQSGSSESLEYKECQLNLDTVCESTQQHLKHVAMRTCCGCGQKDARKKLIRVVLTQSRLTVDYHRALPGRGAWVHPTTQCITQAQRRRAFPRMLKVDATTVVNIHDETLWEELQGVAMSEAPRVSERE